MPEFLVTGLLDGNIRTEQWISAPSPNQAIKIFENLYRTQGVRNVYFTDQRSDVPELQKWHPTAQQDVEQIVRNNGGSSSSSDGDGGGCLLLLLLFGGAALVKFLPYILAAAAIGGGLWLVLSALSSASKDNDEITDYLKNR